MLCVCFVFHQSLCCVKRLEPTAAGAGAAASSGVIYGRSQHASHLRPSWEEPAPGLDVTCKSEERPGCEVEEQPSFSPGCRSIWPPVWLLFRTSPSHCLLSVSAHICGNKVCLSLLATAGLIVLSDQGGAAEHRCCRRLVWLRVEKPRRD